MNCTIRTHGNSRHAITPLTKGLDNDPEQNQTLACLNTMSSDRSRTCEIVSAKRAVKSLLKGTEYMLLTVRHVSTPSTSVHAPTLGAYSVKGGKRMTSDSGFIPESEDYGLIGRTGVEQPPAKSEVQIRVKHNHQNTS